MASNISRDVAIHRPLIPMQDERATHQFLATGTRGDIDPALRSALQKKQNCWLLAALLRRLRQHL
jgi:hypothetical protein